MRSRHWVGTLRRWRAGIVLTMLLGLAAGCSSVRPAGTMDRHAEIFGRWDGYAGPSYRDLERRSLYVEMRDGVRLAADVTLPAPRSAGERLPALLVITRYWRSREGDDPGRLTRFFVAHGYAVVEVDERGTGASFGVWPYPWSEEAIADYGELAAWCARQPWSDGQVAGLGTSYLGTTAQLLAMPANSSVAAVVPKFMELDVFTDIVAPGGVPLRGFLEMWSGFVRELDLGRFPGAELGEGSAAPTVRRVDEDTDGSLRAAAIEEHRLAPEFLPSILSAQFRDETVGELGVAIDDFSVHSFRPWIEASGVPIYGWGSWQDAATADAVITRLLTFSNPQRAVIGAWSHGGGHDTDPFRPADAPVDPPMEVQVVEQLRFLAEHLRAAEPGWPEPKELLYTTLGTGGAWRRTPVWPPGGIEPRSWYFGAGGSLAPAPPGGTGGADRYAVDFAASTGRQNRWFTEADGGDVVYRDRAAADARLLTYTSDPLPGPVEITGHPTVDLFLSSTHEDGAVFVYLEAVSPDGRVVMLTEGALRMIHRTLRIDLPAALGPRPTFLRTDAEPLEPGEVTRLRFTLNPTSARVPAGWRLRLALAGHDAESFARLPETGDPVWMVQRHEAAASAVTLPMREIDRPD